MRLRAMIICSAIVWLPACATVDLSNMAGGEPLQQLAPEKENVVLRSAGALFSAFTEKGWTKAPDPEPLNKAASILLRGLKASPVTTQSITDGDSPNSQILQADLTLASAHVSQTLKSADVYLSMAEPEADLRSELRALEKALLACRKAEVLFEEGRAIHLIDSLETLSSDVDALRDITNIYGERVRALVPITGTPAS